MVVSILIRKISAGEIALSRYAWRVCRKGKGYSREFAAIRGRAPPIFEARKRSRLGKPVVKQCRRARRMNPINTNIKYGVRMLAIVLILTPLAIAAIFALARFVDPSTGRFRRP
jgi:hypothetical protein